MHTRHRRRSNTAQCLCFQTRPLQPRSVRSHHKSRGKTEVRTGECRVAEQEAPVETADPEEYVAAGLADLGLPEVPEAVVAH